MMRAPLDAVNPGAVSAELCVHPGMDWRKVVFGKEPSGNS
jgi:hypothetical protein